MLEMLPHLILEHVSIISLEIKNILLVCKVSLSPVAYASGGKAIAASYWWSGSSHPASDWSDPEQWPAERGTQINVREAPAPGLPYHQGLLHHGAAGGGGQGGERGAGHPHQVQC